MIVGYRYEMNMMQQWIQFITHDTYKVLKKNEIILPTCFYKKCMGK